MIFDLPNCVQANILRRWISEVDLVYFDAVVSDEVRKTQLQGLLAAFPFQSELCEAYCRRGTDAMFKWLLKRKYQSSCVYLDSEWRELKFSEDVFRSVKNMNLSLFVDSTRAAVITQNCFGLERLHLFRCDGNAVSSIISINKPNFELIVDDCFSFSNVTEELCIFRNDNSTKKAANWLGVICEQLLQQEH